MNACGVLTIGLVALCGAAGAESAPNIVMIVSDDAGYNDFGFMADLNGRTTDMLTPNLDALASESVVMSSGYVSAAVCSPSRAGFLTGQYSQRFGYEDNPGENDGFKADQTLISHRLKDLGYTTGAIGKWHVGETDGVNRPLDMGFDEFYGFYHGSRTFWHFPGSDTSRHMRRGDDNIEHLWATEGDASRYDPVNGRYVTDALGEESADFINRHAGAEDPFFLYVSLNAPHTPIEAKSQDLAQFPDIESAGRQKLAAMTLSLDRAVGDINAALAANNIAEDTIIVFFKDNGGPSPSNGAYNNGPLRGHKGSMYEGGIRVPYFIKAPGLTPGVYDEPVSTLDLTPTLVNWAGGDATAIETDGVDLEPFLTGQIADAPHEVMFWRGASGRFAVRKGEWKLVRPGNDTFARLHRVTDDIHEDNYLNSAFPEVVTELVRELTVWESTLQKAEWGAFGASRNEFDHFVFRTDLPADANWSDPAAWHEAGTTDAKTFTPEDSYANAVVEFRTRDDASYTATQDLRRWTHKTFMLNSVILSGQFAGAESRSATIGGNRLLFTNHLTGQAPTIQLDAVGAGGGPAFSFELTSPVHLFDDLEITGDGDQDFVLSGEFSDYDDPRGIRKTGASTVRFAALNTFTGDLQVEGGTVLVADAGAGFSGVQETRVGPAGRLRVEDGVLRTQMLTIEDGGTLELLGGVAQASVVDGDLVNAGANLIAAAAGAAMQVEGALSLQAGVLSYELAAVGAANAVGVTGTLALGGDLQVALAAGLDAVVGDQFVLLQAGQGVSGSFESLVLPTLEDGVWRLGVIADSVVLSVGLAGDFNADGLVDAADYTVWRDGLGTDYAQEHYSVWLADFGRSVPPGGAFSPAAPEPAAAALSALALLSCGLFRARRPASR